MDPVLPFSFFLVAVLYASVGHGGASGYLAVMALLQVAPEYLRPTALVLNLAVSAVGSWYFIRMGHFALRPFIFLCMGSMPLAWLGGTLTLDTSLFRLLLGFTLTVAFIRLLIPISDHTTRPSPHPIRFCALGSVIGFLSGLVGVGGGIFLTPALVLLRWAPLKTAAALSAPFIFVNSLAGLIGQNPSASQFLPNLPLLIIAVLAGGLIGARWGALKAHISQLRITLAAVLFLAAAKLIFT